MKGLLSLFSSSNPNVFFFFTNVGANHYYIGDAMLVIRELVKSYNSSNIYANLKLDQSNVYSIENEGFRFLIAKKVGKIYTAQVKKL
uniref:Uncharacterized protein n=1 Tax=Panagrolaimus superbus TaxID=310955 RepID=A0A914Z8Q8_9BILA